MAASEDGHSGNYLMLRASQTGQHGPGILGIGRLGDGFAVQHDGTVRSDVVTGSRVFRNRVFGSRGGEGFLARQAAHHVRSRFVRELILWDIGWRHPEFDAQTDSSSRRRGDAEANTISAAGDFSVNVATHST